ncbi:MAG: hypothetical protein Q4G51_00735 [Dermatophilus congolensis]|nr:hypothetical protein [Dermatophilus congolensis]
MTWTSKGGLNYLPGRLCLTGARGSGLRLVWQKDGNLVLYRGKVVKWRSDTHNKNATRLALQSDGNLVIYNGKKPLWNSETFHSREELNRGIRFVLAPEQISHKRTSPRRDAVVLRTDPQMQKGTPVLATGDVLMAAPAHVCGKHQEDGVWKWGNCGWLGDKVKVDVIRGTDTHVCVPMGQDVEVAKLDRRIRDITRVGVGSCR